MDIHKRLKINIGSDNFRKMLSESDFFVDKSLFIRDVIESKEEAILITKPRRWGKSLNLDMLKTYFAIETDEQGQMREHNSNRIFFEGGELTNKLNPTKILSPLKIATIDGDYMRLQGQYPVIFVSFKDVTGNNVEDIENTLKAVMIEVFGKYRYLSNSTKLAADQLSKFQNTIDGKFDDIINPLEKSLKFLSQLLFTHHKQRVYIFIDEYDKPLNYLLENYIGAPDKGRVIKDAIEKMTAIFSSCGKSNEYLQKIILTGILDTLKKEGNSGFNNIKVHGIMDPEFGHHFGFSEAEVNQFVDKLSLGDKKEYVKKVIDNWYDGYVLPEYNTASNGTRLYTPWAIVNYLNDVAKGDFEPKSYWSQSGTNVILQNMLQIGALSPELQSKFQHMSKGNEVKLEFDQATSLFKYEFTPEEYNEKMFSYLLVNSGYITARKESGSYMFRIPNYEVKKELEEVIEYELHKVRKQIQLANNNKSFLVSELNSQQDALLNHFHSLYYHYAVEAFQAIIKGNSEELAAIWNKAPKLNCQGDNFNFFHFAAMSKDMSVFNILWDRCEHKLLSEPDNVYGMKPLDYAYLSNNKMMMEKISYFTESQELSLKQSYKASFLFCSDYGVLNTVSFFTILMGLSGISYYFKLVSGFKGVLGGSIASVMFKSGVEYLYEHNKFGLCDVYNKYKQINIDLPTSVKPHSNFNSLIQFEKYKLEYPSSYVTVDKECAKSDTKIAELSSQILFYDGEHTALFGLCSHISDSGEL